MNSLVIYASRTGNTRKGQDAIAEALRTRGSVQLLAADDVPASLPDGTDLVVIGGPTEGHTMTEPLTRLFERCGPGALRALAAVAFDTRPRWPRWLSGSAAADITRHLRVSGARVIAPAESFMVTMKPLLEAGELQRATAWALLLADTVERRPAVASAAGAGC